MTGSCHRMTAIQIEVGLIFVGVDPNTLATHGDNGHFFVCGKLITILDRDRFILLNPSLSFHFVSYYLRLQEPSPPITTPWSAAARRRFGPRFS
jgi:hypothetical protein